MRNLVLIILIAVTLIFHFPGFGETAQKQPGKPDNKKQTPKPQPLTLEQQIDLLKKFFRFDKDNDYLLSIKEFPGNKFQFKIIDIDGDGYVSLKELKASIEAKKGWISLNPASDSSETNNNTGLSIFGTSIWGMNATLIEPEKDLKNAKEMGIRVLRLPVWWEHIEPKESAYDWEKLDSLVKAAHNNRIELLLNLRCISSWGSKYKADRVGEYYSSSLPVNMSSWEKFLVKLSERYKDYSVYYEIENEVNALAYWNGSPEDYAVLLKASYQAIKQGDSRAKVLASGMACGITRNVESSTEAKFRKYHDDWYRTIFDTKAFDIVSIHNYYFPDYEVNNISFKSYIENINELMKEAGVDNKPIWITETGYISRTEYIGNRVDESSPIQQAEWMTQAYIQAGNLGIQRVFWIMPKDRNEPYFRSMGLMNKKGDIKPSFEMMKLFNNRL